MKEGEGGEHRTYTGARLRIALDLSSETMQAGREWSEIFSVEIFKKTTKIPYPSRLSFKNEGER